MVLLTGGLFLGGAALGSGGLLAGRAAWHQYTVRGPLEHVARDWGDLFANEGMVGYGIDRCGVYMPPDTSWRRMAQPDVPLTFEWDPAYLLFNPGADNPPMEFHHPLTTPVAYHPAGRFADPFAGDGAWYGYAIVSWTGLERRRSLPVCGVLHSPGPDRRHDVTTPQLVALLEPALDDSQWGHIPVRKQAVVRSLLAPVIYDPTNGTASGGDLILLMAHNLPEYGYARHGKVEVTGWEESADLSPNVEESIAPWPEEEVVSPVPLVRGEGLRPTVAVPLALHNVLISVGVNLSSPHLEERQQGLLTAGNRLTGLFAVIDAYPRPERHRASRQLEELTREPDDWWQAMEQLRSAPITPDGSGGYVGEPVEVPREAVCAVLPLVGKSMLVLGVRDHDGWYALKLEQLLAAYESALDQPTAHEQRILDELRRLCREYGKG